MNLSESVISSVFFHIIGLLLMMAAMNYTAGLNQGTGNIISVDLSGEEISPPLSDSKLRDEPEAVPDEQDEEEILLPEIKTEKRPETADRTDSPAETAMTERAEPPPIRTEGFKSMEAYYQFIMLHKKIFGRQAGVKVNELLGEAFRVNKRVFYGGVAVVNLRFGADRRLSDLNVDSDSPELKAFLEEINWDSLPAPASFSLGNAGVRLIFTVQEGYMNFSIDTL